MGLVLGLWVGQACGQTQPSQPAPPSPDQWKQSPEGRAASPPTQMNCSGSITTGDGKVEKISNCPSANASRTPTSAAQQFPYPGESKAGESKAGESKAGESKAGENGGSGAEGQNLPGAPVNNNVPAGQKFPYPGENPGDTQAGGGESGGKSAPKPGAESGAGGSGLQDAGSSGDATGASSSSSSSSSAADAAGAPDADTTPIAHRERKKLPAVPRQSPDEREAEDLQVAGFYQNDGNFRGAYDRAKDAVGIADDDPDAHLALAQAARKLGKLDEAEQHFRRCLALDPVPKTRREAERALKEMTGGS